MLKRDIEQSEKIKKLETQYEKENQTLLAQLSTMQQTHDQREYQHEQSEVHHHQEMDLLRVNCEQYMQNAQSHIGLLKEEKQALMLNKS